MKDYTYTACVTGFAEAGIGQLIQPKAGLLVGREKNAYTERLIDVGMLTSSDESNEPTELPPVTSKYLNDIGRQGAANFGVGIADKLPHGMSEMIGTRTLGHENYGNYQYADGSIMVWIPLFYYRWGHPDSPRYAKHLSNALDVKSQYDFADVAAANASGYAVHRAFYNAGELKKGFFVDKFLCSNKSGTASSVKNGIPLSSSVANAPFGGLTGTPANNYAGAIDAVKTRGQSFFVTTIFIQKALSLLSTAHAQGAASVDNCAWYDATGATNYPKGCNNNALGDVNDASVKYTATAYLTAGKTGSAVPFSKTTHNGQNSGVADLNGVMLEISLGVTQRAGNFYALKTTAQASMLKGGATTANDAWGAASMAANYESLGANIGALTGTERNVAIGNGTQQVFSNALSGKEWLASCAGIPMSTGVGETGTDLFGRDRLYDNRIEDACALSGGSWLHYSSAGVWCLLLSNSRANSYYSVGVRAALFIE